MSEPRLLLKNLATGEEVPVVGELVAGRNEQSGLRLATTDTSKPSGTHAILRGVNGVLSVEDMQSTNGTYVNDRRLPPHEKVPLADGSGRVVLVDDLFTNPRLRSLAAVLNR